MPKVSFGRILFATLALAIPLFLVPALCFALNPASFVWSLLAFAFTGWKLRNARRGSPPSVIPATNAFARLAWATVLVQLLAFVWIGAIWALQGVSQFILLSNGLNRFLGWLQTHGWTGALAWVLLFGIVCLLFRLARPIWAWYQLAVGNAAIVLGPVSPAFREGSGIQS
jgi:hypothetical protein